MTLALHDAVLLRGGRRVLNRVSLSLAPGEVVGVLGANGAGKSSLVGALAGDLTLQAGRALLAGQPIAKCSLAQLARQRAVLVQQTALPFDLRVSDIVRMGAYPFAGLGAAALARVVNEALALAGLPDMHDRHYLDLSGGEQQRVQYARVLVQCRAAREPGDSRYLLLDEPTASQDPAHQQHVLRVASGLAHVERVGVLVVLHDVNLAARWCNRILLLAGGQCVAEGTPAAVLTPVNLQRVYGVPALVIPHPQHAERLLVIMD